MTDWRHVRTGRLHLDITAAGDADDLYAIHADPDSWRHFPQGRHVDPGPSREMAAESERQFAEQGLGYWSVREVPGGPVIGRGGCAVPPGCPWWNLYYRLSPAVHGRGYATELARQAVAAAHEVDPARPVLAYLVEHNTASRRTAERVGLRLVWRGPDVGNDDPGAVRLLYLDRPADDDLVAALEEHGMAAAHLV